jgi:hypothetical protein
LENKISVFFAKRADLALSHIAISRILRTPQA